LHIIPQFFQFYPIITACCDFLRAIYLILFLDLLLQVVDLYTKKINAGNESRRDKK
jgi:hypothetical protein